MKKLNIYFDNAATTPPRAREESASHFHGNPSSPHGLGISTERALIAARKEMAGLLSCRENEIIFTSGGTESNNLALLGFALANKRQSIQIFAAPWEHPSVLEPLRFAQEFGIAETITAPLATLRERVKNSRGINLVSISQVSHETGDIFDVAEIAAELKRENPKTIIHVDGVQGFCKEKIDLANIDMYSFSGHKIHGAAGVGGLFVKSGVRLVPLLHGGGQENGIRAGTENVGGILQTVSAAAQLHALRDENHSHAAAIKSELAQLKTDLPDVLENALGSTSPYILNLSFLGIKGETLVHLLSDKGIYASMGAACRSRKKQKSILETMGFSKERAESAVRFSFSHLNTIQEATTAKQIIIDSVSQMRRVLQR
ncbi:MAG: cysteine desulfurase [Defluviitaleaceae bacterium]|nr:cysteine desulfurase [Defluviitaleaceae bacterium]MCL2263386.1 cysteine desulfurase [Defluviitaleaceae bacterium]